MSAMTEATARSKRVAKSAGVQWPLLLALSMAHLMTDFNQGAIPALGPFLTEQYGLDYGRWGTLVMAGLIASAVVQPLLGIYADKARNGRFIPIGIALAGIGMIGIAFAPSFAWVYVFVILSGIGVGAFHPDGMRAAHFLTARLKTTGMAVFQVGGNIGYGLGPAAAAFAVSLAGMAGLVYLGLPAVLWALLMVALLPQILAMWRTPETGDGGVTGADAAQDAPAAGAEQRAAKPERAADAPTRWDGMIMVMLVVLSRAMFQMSMVAFIGLYYTSVLGGSEAWSGTVLSVYLVSGAIGTLLGGPIADRIGPRRYLCYAMLAIPPLHLLTLLSPTWLAALFLAMQGAALVSTYAVSVVLAQSYLPRNLALASGLNVGFGVGMGGVGAALTGLIADAYGLRVALFTLLAYPLLGAFVASRMPKTSVG